MNIIFVSCALGHMPSDALFLPVRNRRHIWVAKIQTARPRNGARTAIKITVSDRMCIRVTEATGIDSWGHDPDAAELSHPDI